MLEKEYNRLFVFGGKNTVSCEYYSFNDKIYSFFGFSYEKNKYTGNIEYIDNKKLDKWYEINEINILNKEITFDIESVSTLLMKNDNNKILIYAGIKGENEDFIKDYYYIFDSKKNTIDLINKWDTKIMKFTGTRWKNYKLSKRDPAGFHFAKNSSFLKLPKKAKIEDYEGDIFLMMDYRNNVHFIDQDKMCIDIYKSDI